MHGQQRTQHQRQPVLHHPRPDPVARRQAHNLRPGLRGHQDDRETGKGAHGRAGQTGGGGQDHQVRGARSRPGVVLIATPRDERGGERRGGLGTKGESRGGWDRFVHPSTRPAPPRRLRIRIVASVHVHAFASLSRQVLVVRRVAIAPAAASDPVHEALPRRRRAAVGPHGDRDGAQVVTRPRQLPRGSSERRVQERQRVGRRDRRSDRVGVRVPVRAH
mmetsp:Transcript_2794/g.11403  ORF Transcript_2794/g.11403 Transcript_2794/m.11403 type:complete len:219 (+) Transcript_2794:466-1122(+)